VRAEDLLTPGRVACDLPLSSRKRVLETLSRLLVEDSPDLPETLVYDRLLARERLGSTAMGHGVAIPHGRIPGLTEARMACLRTREGVDFEALDAEPVDLFCALAVPEEAADAHVRLLARLAEAFSDPELRRRLREAADAAAFREILLERLAHGDDG